MGRRVAVTGAAGFIGAYLVRRLVEQGDHVVAIDNYLRGRPTRLASVASDIEQVDIDVRDVDAMTRTLRGADAAFHLAAINGTENFYRRPALVLDVGVRGAIAVAEACLANEVPDLVVASSAEVYQTPSVVPTPETVPMIVPDSLNPRYSYGGSKLVSELIAFNYCRDRLAKVQVFRPHNVYGPDMGWKHVIPQLVGKAQAAIADQSGSISLQGDGSDTRAFCYVDDVVTGILTMWQLGEPLGIYHIGADDEVTITELARTIAAAAGIPEVVLTPGPAAPGGTPRRCPDITKMRALGYEPAVTLADGVSRTTQWYLANLEPDVANTLL
ncbi:MAG TPA: NAD-dependent epimerase/dehydratase family protein [Coriobacteriia bacterium]|nr:NAD-dependent epimerase/dehydratase family protein [Coriobacteriia bacterium]